MAVLHMCSVFPAKRGKQMIMTLFSDVTNVMLTHRVGGYISRAHKASGLLSGSLELNILVTC